MAATLYALPRSRLCSRCALSIVSSQLRHASSATGETPALLVKIKNDLKIAMKTKNTSRLNVLRAMISEINQAASGPSPITTDMQVLAMLKKRKAASETAAKEAEQAKRDDLKHKQETEIGILDEYAGSVKVMPADELRSAVDSALEVVAANTPIESIKPGILMKELLKPGGRLESQPVDKAELAKIVQEVLKTNSKAV